MTNRRLHWAIPTNKLYNLGELFFFRRAKFERPESIRDKENLVKYKGKRTSQDVVFIVFSSLRPTLQFLKRQYRTNYKNNWRSNKFPYELNKSLRIIIKQVRLIRFKLFYYLYSIGNNILKELICCFIIRFIKLHLRSKSI